jgi:hypothetical protein
MQQLNRMQNKHECTKLNIVGDAKQQYLPVQFLMIKFSTVYQLLYLLVDQINMFLPDVQRIPQDR